MAVVVKNPAKADAQGYLSATVNENGVATWTHKVVGTLTELKALFTNFQKLVGTVGEYGFRQSARLSTTTNDFATLERIYVSEWTANSSSSVLFSSDGITVELSTTLMETPLTNADAFKTLTPTDWKAMQLYVDATSQEEVDEYWAAFPPSDEATVMKAVKYRLAGVSGFLVPSSKVRISETSEDAPTLSGGVGKKGTPNTPAGVQIPKDVEWLKSGETITMTKNGDAVSYTHVQEWTSATKWDDDLYGDGGSSS